jgi:hypothetical protein
VLRTGNLLFSGRRLPGACAGEYLPRLFPVLLPKAKYKQELVDWDEATNSLSWRISPKSPKK